MSPRDLQKTWQELDALKEKFSRCVWLSMRMAGWDGGAFKGGSRTVQS